MLLTTLLESLTQLSEVVSRLRELPSHVCELGLVARSFSARCRLTLFELKELVPCLGDLGRDFMQLSVDGLALDLLVLHRQRASAHLIAVHENIRLELGCARGHELQGALEVLRERVPVLPALSKQRLRNIVPLLAPRPKFEAGASALFTTEIV